MSKNFENIVKQKLESLEIEPRAGLFADIISKRKKKKRAAWIWSSAAVILIVSGIALYVTNTNVKNVSIDNVTDYENSTVREVEKAEPALPEIVSVNEDKNVVEIEDQSQNKINSPSRSNKLEYNIVDADIQVEESENTRTDIAVEKETQNETLANLYKEIIQESAELNSGKEGTFYLKDFELELDRKPLKIKAKPTKEGTLEKDDANKNKGGSEPTIALSEPSNDDPDFGDINDKPSKFGIELSSGLGRNVSIFYGDDITSRYRTDFESNQLAYNIDLRGFYRISSNLSFKTGLVYNQIRDNFKYQYDSKVNIQNRTEIRQVEIIHPVLGKFTLQQEVNISDTTIIEGATVNKKNNYTSIFIPLGIEKSIFISDKFIILPQISALFGLSQKVSGSYLHQQNEVALLSNGRYRSSALSQLEIGLGASYKLNDIVDVYVQPRITTDLNSRLEGLALKQNNIGFYTQFGVRIEL